MRNWTLIAIVGAVSVTAFAESKSRRITSCQPLKAALILWITPFQSVLNVMLKYTVTMTSILVGASLHLMNSGDTKNNG